MIFHKERLGYKVMRLGHSDQINVNRDLWDEALYFYHWTCWSRKPRISIHFIFYVLLRFYSLPCTMALTFIPFLLFITVCVLCFAMNCIYVFFHCLVSRETTFFGKLQFGRQHPFIEWTFWFTPYSKINKVTRKIQKV